jgi:hypothetical protein
MDQSQREASKEAQRLIVAEARMDKMVREVRSQAYINLPLALLFGCWPLLQSFSGYFLPVPWTSAGIVSGVLLLSGAPNDRFVLLCMKSKVDESSGKNEDADSSLKSNNTGGSIRVMDKQDSFVSSAQDMSMSPRVE